MHRPQRGSRAADTAAMYASHHSPSTGGLVAPRRDAHCGARSRVLAYHSSCRVQETELRKAVTPPAAEHILEGITTGTLTTGGVYARGTTRSADPCARPRDPVPGVAMPRPATDCLRRG